MGTIGVLAESQRMSDVLKPVMRGAMVRTENARKILYSRRLLRHAAECHPSLVFGFIKP